MKKKFFKYKYKDNKCSKIKKVIINFNHCKKAALDSNRFSFEKTTCNHIEIEKDAETT